MIITPSLCLVVSLDSIVQDVRALERGMEVTRREFSVEKDNPVLQTFLSKNTELLNSLIADGKTAQVNSNQLKITLHSTICHIFLEFWKTLIKYF